MFKYVFEGQLGRRILYSDLINHKGSSFEKKASFSKKGLYRR